MLNIFYVFFSMVLVAFGLHRMYLVVSYLRIKKVTKSEGLSENRIKKNKIMNDALVTIQLPIYNESKVALRVLKACAAIQWPRHLLEIQILDDSTDQTQEILKKACLELQNQGFDVQYLHRSDREGYKAGALAEGLKVSKGDFLLILDADFVAPKDILEKCMYPFVDPQIAMVQTRWGHLNEDQNWLTRAQALLLDSHFSLGHMVRHHLGHFFNFNGTSGIWRKTSIIEAGGWKASTLTEDLDLSLRSFLKGAHFYYIDDFVDL